MCLNYAVSSSQEDFITFYDCDANTLSTSNIDWLQSSKSRFFCYTPYQTIKCKTISIDRLIELYGVPDLIKIDVEGGEYDTLKSLTAKAKNICFEWAAEMNDITLNCIQSIQIIK